MTIEPRTVFDTGVVVSAVLLPRSIPRRAFDLATVSGRLLASQSTIDELEEVLRRPKFNKYVSEQARLEFLAALVSEAEIVPITQQIAACRDATDDKFLELAISGQASHLVSGDADLLVLHPFRGVAIVRPDEFVHMLMK
jgi:putative PIN family toxin of toxin-antitoxin system